MRPRFFSLITTFLFIFVLRVGCLAGGLERLDKEGAALYAEYTGLIQAPNVEKLVNFDRKLRELVENLPGDIDDETRNEHWKHIYDEMGLQLGHYGGILYSERWLREAHKLDPHSALRGYTLFSEILGERTNHRLGEMPNLEIAHKYEKEFPDGPFIEEVWSILGGFFKDLFMVLELGPERSVYKWECYRGFISELPLKEQKENARKKALWYYEAIVTRNPQRIEASEIKRTIEKIRNFGLVDHGYSGPWSFCAD